MAKRKDLTSKKASNPVELAGPVSDRVQIQNVIISECAARRLPQTDPNDKSFELKIGIPKFGVSKEEADGTLFVFLVFELTGTQAGSSGEAENSLSMSATFVLHYTMSSFEHLTDSHLRAFAQVNGVFNAWPFWREYVQSTSSRLGLPAITVPVHRVPTTTPDSKTSRTLRAKKV